MLIVIRHYDVMFHIVEFITAIPPSSIPNGDVSIHYPRLVHLTAEGGGGTPEDLKFSTAIENSAQLSCLSEPIHPQWGY